MSDSDNPFSPSFANQMNVSVDPGSVTPGSRPGAANATAEPGAFLGQPPSGGDWIKDTTTANFTADVIAESRNQPVLVDFWAPWCGPCKQLTPILEKVVLAAGGRVRLVKMNIDEHPAIPGQLGIQSIPAVIAFVNGQPADGFMGAVPESQVRQFVDRLAASAGGGEAEAIDAMLEEARAALKSDDAETAAQTYSAILQHRPGHAKASAGMAECLMAAGREADAEALLEDLDSEARKDADVVGVLARLAQAREAAKLGDPRALQARLDDDPSDHAARFDLAKILSARGEREAAAEHLLTIMRKDRDWRDDAARQALIGFFEAWGPTDPATVSARRKLSSILFS